MTTVNKNKMDLLQEKLGQLQRNEEKVGKTLLKERYAKGYRALLDEINTLAKSILSSFITSGLRVLKEDTEWAEFIRSGWQRIVREELEKGWLVSIGQTLRTSYDAESLILMALPVHRRIQQEVYLPYWLDRTRFLSEEGCYYNSILNMRYDESSGCWTNGSLLCPHYPPTKELCEKQLLDERAEDERELARRKAQWFGQPMAAVS